MKVPHYDSLMHSAKDYIVIVLGLLLYALGFTAFILPQGVVIGGVAGIGTLVYFASGGFIPVAVTQYVVNLILLAIAFRIVGKTFVLRTIFGASVISLAIGLFEGYFMSRPPLIAETSMSVIMGAILCGIGIGVVFIHNGSSGGTDIVAAMVSKVSNVSVGRIFIFCDMSIVLLSIFLPFDGTLDERIQERVSIIVYGWVVTFIIAYLTDTVINTNRQATQFFIFSHKWAEIADAINQDAHRGVTVVDAEGWYSKTQIKVLMVWCRKIESVTIFRIVKSIDENAFITQTNTNGVYGKGFDKMKVKLKSQEIKSSEAKA
ncbi:MAG: YitT family protein [Muribaculaceae bacterium]|nr:YitT family protein [Muribaculaceae bacterium]